MVKKCFSVYINEFRYGGVYKLQALSEHVFFTIEYSILCNVLLTGIQSLSQTDGNTDTMNMLTIVIPVIAALVIFFLVVVIACFLKRKKASQQPSKREEKFQNPIFIGQGNDAFSGPSVEEYDQIPADKVTDVNLKND